MRIVFSGSAANPPTCAHLEIGEIMTQCGLFDRAIWLPSGERADKPHIAAAEHRLHMTELLFSPEWRASRPIPFEIDTRDIGRQNTPTILLWRELRERFPDAELTFAVGADVLMPSERFGGKCEIAHHWIEGETLLREANFLVIPRRGYPDPDTLTLPIRYISAKKFPASAASSTDVRERITRGLPFEHLVTPEVAAYIKENNLYQTHKQG